MLGYEKFDDALTLLDQASSEGIQLDVVIMNTILQKACDKVPSHGLMSNLSVISGKLPNSTWCL